MYTGLVQTIGTVCERLDQPRATRLIVDPGRWEQTFDLGESIAVDGCCLTLADRGARGQLFFDVIPETLGMTTLGSLHPGDTVNLERSATPESMLGGHVVQGHVDGVGEVVAVQTVKEHRVRIRLPEPLMPAMTPKGAIAIQGVSLTLAKVDVPAREIEVALIPVTLRDTTLHQLDRGSRVNIECDIIAKTVVHWLENFGPGRQSR